MPGSSQLWDLGGIRGCSQLSSLCCNQQCVPRCLVLEVGGQEAGDSSDSYHYRGTSLEPDSALSSSQLYPISVWHCIWDSWGTLHGTPWDIQDRMDKCHCVSVEDSDIQVE